MEEESSVAKSHITSLAFLRMKRVQMYVHTIQYATTMAAPLRIKGTWTRTFMCWTQRVYKQHGSTHTGHRGQ